MNHSHDIVNTFEEILNENKCHDLARHYKFIQRSSSKLKGHEFINIMILPAEGVTTDSLKGLCKRMKEINSEANLSAQALCERINNASSVDLMRGVFAQVLLNAQSKFIQKNLLLTKTLSKFETILIEDSTVCTLNEKLASHYP